MSSGYGELLEEATGGILLSYRSYGSYQGDYIAVIEKDSNILIFKGRYGSCSGCDWLDGAGEWVEDADGDSEKIIPFEEKQIYLEGNPPFLTIPRDQIPDTAEELLALLPANTRLDFDDEDINDTNIESVFKQLKNPDFNNIDYIEKKYDRRSPK